MDTIEVMVTRQSALCCVRNYLPPDSNDYIGVFGWGQLSG